MTFLLRVKKADLLVLAREFGVEAQPENTITQMKNAIVASDSYEEEGAKALLSTITEERLAREQREHEAEKRDHELKLRQLEVQNDRDRESSDAGMGNGSEGVSFLNYLNVMRGVTLEPPNRAEEWPYFFHHAEMMFALYEVPERFQGKIILHALKGRAKGLTTALGGKDLENYMKIKEVLLKQNQITPLQHKKNWENCRKKDGESYLQFAARLEASLDLYLQARETTDLQTCKQLWVADRIKDGLPHEIKSHVLLKESEKWLPVEGLVSVIDNFIAAMPQDEFLSANPDRRENNWKFEGNLKKRPAGAKKMLCFHCNKEGHVIKDCPRLLGNTKNVPKSAKVQTVNTGERTDDAQITDGEGENNSEGRVLIAVAGLRSRGGNNPHLERGICKLKRVPVTVNGKGVAALLDSASQMTVIARNLLPGIRGAKVASYVYLQGIFGGPVKCPVVKVSLAVEGGSTQVVNCAVSPKLRERVLLPPGIFFKLKGTAGRIRGDNVISAFAPHLNEIIGPPEGWSRLQERDNTGNGTGRSGETSSSGGGRKNFMTVREEAARRCKECQVQKGGRKKFGPRKERFPMKTGNVLKERVNSTQSGDAFRRGRRKVENFVAERERPI